MQEIEKGWQLCVSQEMLEIFLCSSLNLCTGLKDRYLKFTYEQNERMSNHCAFKISHYGLLYYMSSPNNPRPYQAMVSLLSTVWFAYILFITIQCYSFVVHFCIITYPFHHYRLPSQEMMSALLQIWNEEYIKNQPGQPPLCKGLTRLLYCKMLCESDEFKTYCCKLVLRKGNNDNEAFCSL